jgi:hypothetical protein
VPRVETLFPAMLVEEGEVYSPGSMVTENGRRPSLPGPPSPSSSPSGSTRLLLPPTREKKSELSLLRDDEDDDGRPLRAALPPPLRLRPTDPSL